MIVSRRTKLQARKNYLFGTEIQGGVARVVDVEIEHLAFSDAPDVWITYLAVEGDEEQKHDEYRITVELLNPCDALAVLDACDFFAYKDGPNRGTTIFLRKDKVK